MANVFIGIDLGTTNTVLSYGTENTKNGFDARILDVTMMNESKGLVRKPLLPSYIFINNPGDPVVGEFAKKMIETRSDRVIKVIKNDMGKNVARKIGETDFSPAQLSSFILTQLKSSFKRNFEFDPEDVIITVPASFGPDARAATLEAAKLAGFNTDKNILLDEPKAALFDFVNRQLNGEIIDTVINFDEPKYVLVYDLGGGTLDVSLHKVRTNPETKALEIEDISVSPHTLIGGYNFDKLLAEHFRSHFVTEDEYIALSQADKKRLDSILEEYAERAKIELNSEIENKRAFNNTLNLEGISTEIFAGEIMPDIFPDRMFTYTLTFEEYENIISPLLASNLSYTSLDNFDSIPGNEYDQNIIYAVLYTLEKAKTRFGSIPKIDAVLFNGGMTKHYAVQKRVEELFNSNKENQPTFITAGDPDKAVARGAAFYQYLLNKNLVTNKNVVNEYLGIEINNGTNDVWHIVKAGSELPFSCEYSFKAPRTGAKRIDLPIYIGMRKDTRYPNKKIADRSLVFDRELIKDEEIKVKIDIDLNNVLTITGWCSNDYNNKHVALVNVHNVDKTETKTQADVQVSEKSEPAKPKSKIVLNKVTIRALQQKLEEMERIAENHEKSNDQPQKKAYMDRIKTIESQILEYPANYTVAEEIKKQLVKVSSRKNVLIKQRVLFLLGNLATKADQDTKRNISDYLLDRFCSPMILHGSNIKNINTVTRFAIEAIGKTGYCRNENQLIELYKNTEIESIRPAIFITLGKTVKSSTSADFIISSINSKADNVRIPIGWALGRICSRQKNTVTSDTQSADLAVKILKRLRVEEHEDCARNLIYALGEILDTRERPFSTGMNITTDAYNFLKGLVYNLNTIPWDNKNKIANISKLSMKMIKGEKLDKEQEVLLLEMRDLLTA